MPTAPRRRSAFTLVEMMMVVVIIGILAGLVTFAASAAIKRVKEGRALLEISQVDMALKQYKTDRGGYPPCMADYTQADRPKRFIAHVRRAFPRATVTDYVKLRNDLASDYDPSNSKFGLGKTTSGAYVSLDALDPAETLVFWLGGLPTPRDNSGVHEGTTKLMGFAANPSNPFQIGANVARTDPLFAFDETRLVDYDQDGWYEYIPALSDGSGQGVAPYVYYDAGTYFLSSSATNVPMAYPNNNSTMKTPGNKISAWGAAVPYMKSVDPLGFLNPDSFQIICAGADGVYSEEGYGGPDPANAATTWPAFPGGQNFRSGDSDNLTSFYGEGTLEDGLEE